LLHRFEQEGCIVLFAVKDGADSGDNPFTIFEGEISDASDERGFEVKRQLLDLEHNLGPVEIHLVHWKVSLLSPERFRTIVEAAIFQFEQSGEDL